MTRGYAYDGGMTNIDHETGIRYGVIPQGDVLQAWCDSSEADYGPASCGKCGNEAVEISEVPFDLDDAIGIREDGRFSKHDVLRIPAKHRKACGGNSEWHDEGRDYACLSCCRSFNSDDAYGDEPRGHDLDDGEYLAHQGGDDCDIFVLKSPYYTFGPFCSPCAPGAVYLRDAHGDCDRGARAYCFAPDWFEAYTEADKTGEYNGDDTSCPYAVFRVADDVCVFQPKAEQSAVDSESE